MIRRHPCARTTAAPSTSTRPGTQRMAGNVPGCHSEPAERERSAREESRLMIRYCARREIPRSPLRFRYVVLGMTVGRAIEKPRAGGGAVVGMGYGFFSHGG